MSGNMIEASIIVDHSEGLHARPSVKLTKLAKGFTSRIELSTTPEGPWIDAKSIVKVMAMRAPRHATLHFRAQGEDAREAVNALIGLVMRDFDEDHVHAAGG